MHMKTLKCPWENAYYENTVHTFEKPYNKVNLSFDSTFHKLFRPLMSYCIRLVPGGKKGMEKCECIHYPPHGHGSLTQVDISISLNKLPSILEFLATTSSVFMAVLALVSSVLHPPPKFSISRPSLKTTEVCPLLRG